MYSVKFNTHLTAKQPQKLSKKKLGLERNYLHLIKDIYMRRLKYSIQDEGEMRSITDIQCAQGLTSIR